MKVAVYAIAKNEEKHVERFMESVSEFDGVFVMDTGSTDNTIQALEYYGATVVTSTVSPFRFDVARNASMNMIPLEYDYLLCLDMDEVLEEGAYAKIVEAISSNPKASYNLKLIYDADREAQMLVPKKCLHTRKNHFWKYNVHETLVSHDSVALSNLDLDITIYHHPDHEKDRGFYMELLEQSVTSYPNDPRPLMYLGREHFYVRNTFDAIMWLKQHIKVEPYGPFRCRSAMMIAEAYENLNVEDNVSEAEAWLLRACSEFNHSREPYYRLAELYFEYNAFSSAIGMFDACLRIKEVPDVSDIVELKYYDDKVIYHYIASSYYNLGMIDQAKKAGQKALSLYNSSNMSLPETLVNDLSKIFSDIIEGSPNAESKEETQSIQEGSKEE